LSPIARYVISLKVWISHPLEGLRRGFIETINAVFPAGGGRGTLSGFTYRPHVTEDNEVVIAIPQM
jgi:hypothetical protein